MMFDLNFCLITSKVGQELAGEVGIEPTTNGLTVRGSTAELFAKKRCGLLSDGYPLASGFEP